MQQIRAKTSANYIGQFGNNNAVLKTVVQLLNRSAQITQEPGASLNCVEWVFGHGDEDADWLVFSVNNFDHLAVYVNVVQRQMVHNQMHPYAGPRNLQAWSGAAVLAEMAQLVMSPRGNQMYLYAYGVFPIYGTMANQFKLNAHMPNPNP